VVVGKRAHQVEHWGTDSEALDFLALLIALALVEDDFFAYVTAGRVDHHDSAGASIDRLGQGGVARSYCRHAAAPRQGDGQSQDERDARHPHKGQSEMKTKSPCFHD